MTVFYEAWNIGRFLYGFASIAYTTGDYIMYFGPACTVQLYKLANSNRNTASSHQDHHVVARFNSIRATHWSEQ